MLEPKLQERRDSVRQPGSYPVQVWDSRKRAVGRGRTANISERGVYVLLPDCPHGRQLAINHAVQIDMDLPKSPEHIRRIRRVSYRARVIRVEPMGHWLGIALELLDKLG